jgi:hypothetical protein
MIRVRGWRRVLWVSAVLLLLSAAGFVMLTLPLTTRQGVDHRVTIYRIPAYVKAIAFLQRHFQYQLLVSRICPDTTSEVECVLAILDWTHTNIPRTPEGWTVVDDHVTNIIIRGHGDSDQIADVFVTLTSYAGVPAVFRWLTNSRDDVRLVLAFAHLDGEWVPFDVERHLVFRDRNGQLANVDELVADPALIDAQTQDVLLNGDPYSSLMSKETLLPFVVPRPLRAEMQQPWPRLRYELRRVAGLEREKLAW